MFSQIKKPTRLTNLTLTPPLLLLAYLGMYYSSYQTLYPHCRICGLSHTPWNSLPWTMNMANCCNYYYHPECMLKNQHTYYSAFSNFIHKMRCPYCHKKSISSGQFINTFWWTFIIGYWGIKKNLCIR